MTDAPISTAGKSKSWALGWAFAAAVATAMVYAAVQQVREAPPHRCEVTLPESGCSKHPDFEHGAPNSRFLDDFESAADNEKRCYSRAEDFYKWCALEEPVKVRYFRNWRRMGFTQYPPP